MRRRGSYRTGNAAMSNYRMMRIGLLIVVVAGGLLLHHRGHAYEAMRVVYLVVIVGFLLWRLALRSGRAPRRRREPGPPPEV
jgi:hypothetical protein